MIINEKTRISELIRANKRSIDAIAAIAKPFEKLKNPILRKIMAPRVTLAEAAKMGGVSINAFADALAPLGFEMQQLAITHQTNPEIKPDWLKKAPQEHISVFDVRPIIDNGSDPLKEILHEFKDIQAGKILCVINTFIPTPLIQLLKQDKADDAYVETINANEHHTYFLKKTGFNNDNQTPEPGIMMDDEAQFEAYCATFPEQAIKVIDVRRLEMPGPMQMILDELKELPPGHLLFIHHKRVPVFLLEDLAEQNYTIHIHDIAEGNVRMTITK